ncbi:hypothetical protein LEP1GSC047_2270 [Leptospira inadai serovar Lyme str. 10]|uniref:Uncharacterized protein n=1 Tax=Leptospira inadai serovar Lyme str. 10 TaxID=1049790 RepID=V6HNC7_9LEPT|nr:hypothetical protein LEP1GSC047_2270 [Leptospira inadai serovar Lyme str. 10]
MSDLVTESPVTDLNEILTSKRGLLTGNRIHFLHLLKNK